MIYIIFHYNSGFGAELNRIIMREEYIRKLAYENDSIFIPCIDISSETSEPEAMRI